MTRPMITWNMQGGTNSIESKWVKDVQFLLDKFPDNTVICLQEAGAPPPRAEPEPLPAQGWLTDQPPGEWQYLKWKVGTKRTQKDIFILWYKTDTSPKTGRVNLAIASMSAPTGLLYVPSGDNGENQEGVRPSIGMELNPDRFYTIHALASSRDRGRKTLKLIENISRLSQPWYALGDYNCQPDNWETAPAGTICPPDKATHQNGEKLDYMIRYRTGGDRGVTGQVQPEGPIWSDHAFVFFGTSNGTPNISNSTQTIVKLKCLGDVDGPRFLDGRTGDGTVGLAPSTDGFSGTRWELSVVNDAITFKCLGDVDGPRFLDGRTGDGTVGLAPTADTNPGGDLSGTRWGLSNVSPGVETVECFGSVPGPKFLDGRTGDGSVGLAPSTDGLSGTKWEITPF